MNDTSDWPSDSDGDVLRRLRDHGIDFGRPHAIDFNVDFSVWPPAPEAIALLKREFQLVTIHDPDGQSGGDVVVKVVGIVSYSFVVQMQATISELMVPFGGVCEGWGVLLAAKNSN